MFRGLLDARPGANRIRGRRVIAGASPLRFELLISGRWGKVDGLKP